MSRDHWSYEQLRELLGEDFSEYCHLTGVDVAFALPATEGSLDREPWPSETPVVGINVSGLLYLDPQGPDRFGLASDYRHVIDVA
jgi:colanic acid/amylovoran biosynthesis protein